jgi:hypothetical protein
MASILKFDVWQGSNGVVKPIVLQTKTTSYVTTYGNSSSSPVDVSGFSVSITPSSVNSKILVMVTCFMGGDNDTYGYIVLKRNGTVVGSGESPSGVRGIFAGSYLTNLGTSVQYTMRNLSNNFLDSPATTSAITYQIAMASPYVGSSYINRQANQIANASYTQQPSSSITVMEIAG